MLPTDIKYKALRDTYYTVQSIIAKRYESALSATTDRETRKRLTEQFNRDIRNTINYYVNLASGDAHILEL